MHAYSTQAKFSDIFEKLQTLYENIGDAEEWFTADTVEYQMHLEPYRI